MNKRSLSKLSLPVALAGLLASGCAQKPDEYYVGKDQADAVQQLRKLFNDDFGMACGEHYPLDEYDPVNRTYVTTPEGKDRALDAALDEVLMRRNAIRRQLVLSARQKKALPREIRCLTQMSWTCSHKTGTGFYTRCGNPVNDY